MDGGLMEHLDKLAMNRCLFGFLCTFGIQNIHGKYRSSSLVCTLKEVRADLGLSIISDAKIFVRWQKGFPSNELTPSSSAKKSLADKCIVVRCSVCGQYDNSLMESCLLVNGNIFFQCLLFGVEANQNISVFILYLTILSHTGLYSYTLELVYFN